LAFKFPLDYRLFLKLTNGAEFAGAAFWSTGEPPVYNIECQFPEFAPWFVGEAIGYLRAKPEQGCSPFPLSGCARQLHRAAEQVSCWPHLLGDDASN
jgi:hypothetical protein